MMPLSDEALAARVIRAVDGRVALTHDRSRRECVLMAVASYMVLGCRVATWQRGTASASWPPASDRWPPTASWHVTQPSRRPVPRGVRPALSAAGRAELGDRVARAQHPDVSAAVRVAAASCTASCLRGPACTRALEPRHLLPMAGGAHLGLRFSCASRTCSVSCGTSCRSGRGSRAGCPARARARRGCGVVQTAALRSFILRSLSRSGTAPGPSALPTGPWRVSHDCFAPGVRVARR